MDTLYNIVITTHFASYSSIDDDEKTVSILFSNFLMNRFHTELCFITLKSLRKCNCIVVLARIRSFDLSHITFGKLITYMNLAYLLSNVSQHRSTILYNDYKTYNYCIDKYILS